jgi:PAS domain S-box-containing protein
VPTARFRVLFVFVVLAHHRRRVGHFNVTEHSTTAWTAQQLGDAFPDDSAPAYLLRDRDRVYGQPFRHRVKGMGIEELLTAPQSPWQNPFAERLIGSIRRECLNHVLVLGERHVRRVLVRYFSYYHRAHLALDKDAPGRRPIELPATGTIGAPAAVGETRSPGLNPGSQPWPRVSRGAERVGRRFDGEGQVIRLWNLAAETMFGHGATEAIGQTLDLIVPEPHRVAHWAGFSHAVKQGRFAKNDVLLTSRALTKDGRIIAAELLGRHCPEPLWPSSGHHGRLDEM